MADLPKSEPGRQIPVEFTGSHRSYKTGKFKRMVGCDPHKAVMKLFCMLKVAQSKMIAHNVTDSMPI